MVTEIFSKRGKDIKIIEGSQQSQIKFNKITARKGYDRESRIQSY
jgi:hypothetical protein